MTLTQQIITIGLCILGTMLTRFLPFLIFRENRKTPEVIQYIGKYLPAAVFGMLVVYCLRNVSIVSRQSRTPGADRHSGDLRTAPLETADSALHCRRHGVLYAVAALCICLGLLHSVFVRVLL